MFIDSKLNVGHAKCTSTNQVKSNSKMMESIRNEGIVIYEEKTMEIFTESFTLMDENTELARVSFSKEHGKYEANVEKVLPADYPLIAFPFSYKDSGFVRGEILDFLKSRCFEETRPDKREILEMLGLSEYNPLEITKKTHGRLYHYDTMWIRWEGETLTWEDVYDKL